jgi:hypothetical protein
MRTSRYARTIEPVKDSSTCHLPRGEADVRRRTGPWRRTMEYVLLRYRGRPDQVTGLTSTSRPKEVVEFVRTWSRRDPDEGVIVAIRDRPVVHCAPRTR